MCKYSEGISGEASTWDDEESARPLSVSFNEPLVLLKQTSPKSLWKTNFPSAGTKKWKMGFLGNKRTESTAFRKLFITAVSPRSNVSCSLQTKTKKSILQYLNSSAEDIKPNGTFSQRMIQPSMQEDLFVSREKSLNVFWAFFSDWDFKFSCVRCGASYQNWVDTETWNNWIFTVSSRIQYLKIFWVRRM